MLSTQYLFANCQGALMERLNLLVFSALPKIVPYTIEQACRFGKEQIILLNESITYLRVQEILAADIPVSILWIGKNISHRSHLPLCPHALCHHVHLVFEHFLYQAMDRKHI